MKEISWTVIAVFSFLSSQAQLVQDNNKCAQWRANVTASFNDYKSNENNMQSQRFFKAAAQADSLLSQCGLEEQERVGYVFRKAVLELYGLIVLNSFEFHFVRDPAGRKKKFEEMIRVLRTSTGNQEATRYLNHILGCYDTYVAENYEEAEKYFKKADSLGSPWDILLKDRAWNFLQWGMKEEDKNPGAANRYFDGAEITARRCQAVNPGLSFPYIILGYVHEHKRNINMALSDFDSAEQLNPANREINLAKGYCFGKMRNWDTALLFDGRTVQMSPGCMTAYANMALHYALRSRPHDADSAYALYERCIAFNQQDPKYYKNMGDFFSLYTNSQKYPHRSDSIRYYYGKAAQLDATYMEDLADYYYDLGLNDSAIVMYRQKLKGNANMARLYFKIGRSYYVRRRDRDNDSAVSYFQKAVSLDSGYAWAHLLLGEAAYGKTADRGNQHLDQFLSLPLPGDQDLPVIVYKLIRFADSLVNKNEEIPTAYKYYKTAARLGNEGARFAALGLKYEMGFDEGRKDTAQSVFWYQQAAQRFPVMQMAWKRLMRFSQTGRWPVADHVLWKQLADLKGAALKQQEVSVINREGSEKTFPVMILAGYPRGVHPLQWEGQRLIADLPDYTIRNAAVNRWGMNMAFFKEKKMSGMTFIEACNYLDHLNELSKYDSIVQRSLIYLRGLSEKNKVEQLGMIDDHLKNMLAVDSTPYLREYVSNQYAGMAREYILLKDPRSYEWAIAASEKALQLSPANVSASSALFSALWCGGQTGKAKNVYTTFRPSAVYKRDDYNDIFLNDIGFFLKEEKDTVKKKQFRQLLLPAGSWIDSSRGLHNKNFKQLTSSSDTAGIYTAVTNALRSDNKDTMQLAKGLIERLNDLSHDSLYAVKYLDCLLYLSILDPGFSPPRDVVEKYIKQSGLPPVEYGFIQYYLSFMDKTEFEDLINAELNNWKREDDANDFRFWIDRAEFFRSNVRYGVKSSNTSKVLAARKAVDWYGILQRRFLQDTTWQKTIAADCGGFSYTIITLRDYRVALKAALVAQAANPAEPYYKTNLPLACLLSGDVEKAKELYLQWKDLPFTGDDRFKTYGQVFLNDFDDLEKNYGFDPGIFKGIRDLLK